jgi:carbon storage regulator
MLVLTRKIGEDIIANNNISFTALSIKGKQVRVGIQALDSIVVHRGEVMKRIHQNENSASK